MTEQNSTGKKWINNLEIEDAQCKWSFSHFAGEADTYNAEGQHNFVVIIPPETVPQLIEDEWPIKKYEAMDEGGDPEYTLKVNISYKFEAPRIFFIKNGRKFQAEQKDLKNIKRGTVIRMDVIIKPSRWVRPDREGISAYVEEMYIEMHSNRFEERYADLEEV